MSSQLYTHEPISDNNNDDDEEEEVAFHDNNNTIENNNTNSNSNNAVHNFSGTNNNEISNTITNYSCNVFNITMESTTSQEPSEHPLSTYQVKQNEQDDSIQMNELFNNNNSINIDNNNAAISVINNDNCDSANRTNCTSVTCNSKSYSAFCDEFYNLLHYCCTWMFILSVLVVAAWSLAGNACRIALHNAFQHQRFFVTYEYFGPNCIGCFVMGCLVVLLPNESDLPLIHRALCVGFCGSFTTFSGWVLDVTNKRTAAGAFEELISGLTMLFIFFILGRDISLALLYVLEWCAAFCHVHLFHLVPTDKSEGDANSSCTCNSDGNNINVTNKNYNNNNNNNNDDDGHLMQECVQHVDDSVNNNHNNNANRLLRSESWCMQHQEQQHEEQVSEEQQQLEIHHHHNREHNNLHNEDVRQQQKAVLTSHKYKEAVKAHRRRHEPCVFITSFIFLLVSVAAAIAVPIAIQVRINQKVINTITDAQLKAVVMAPTGAVIRYCLAVAFNKRVVIKCFPLGTLLANILGVFIGVFVDNYAFRRPWNTWYWIALNGVCGALSTVSSFVNEVHGFYISHQFVMAYFYLCVSVVITITIGAIGRRDNYQIGTN